MESKMTSQIVIAGLIVLCAFTIIATSNLLPNNKASDSYYAKTDDKMVAKIESLEIDKKGILTISTSGESKAVCVKTTKTAPSENSICWMETNNNEASISIYKTKKYYAWIKDSNDNISSPTIINPEDEMYNY